MGLPSDPNKRADLIDLLFKRCKRIGCNYSINRHPFTVGFIVGHRNELKYFKDSIDQSNNEWYILNAIYDWIASEHEEMEDRSHP